MRLIISALILGALTPAAAFAQAAPAAKPAPAPAPAPAGEHYSTSGTDIGTLLDNPATKAVLEKEIPAIVNNDGINQARSMTFKDIQQYAGDALSDATLAKIDAELATIPVKK